MMKKSFLTSLLSLSIFFVMGVALVYAQPQQGGGTNPPQGGGTNVGNVGVSVNLSNPFNCGGVQPCTLFTFLKALVNSVVLPIGGVLAVLAFIYSGFLYVTAQGNETKLKTAHKALLYTSIGTAVLLGAWVLANVICKTIEQLGGPACPSL